MHIYRLRMKNLQKKSHGHGNWLNKRAAGWLTHTVLFICVFEIEPMNYTQCFYLCLLAELWCFYLVHQLEICKSGNKFNIIFSGFNSVSLRVKLQTSSWTSFIVHIQICHQYFKALTVHIKIQLYSSPAQRAVPGQCIHLPSGCLQWHRDLLLRIRSQASSCSASAA